MDRRHWSGGLFVRRRDGGCFLGRIPDVAVEVGLYDGAAEGGGKSSENEDLLAIFDGAAIKAIRAVDESEIDARMGVCGSYRPQFRPGRMHVIVEELRTPSRR